MNFFKKLSCGLAILAGFAIGASAQDPQNALGNQPFTNQNNEIALDTLNIHLDIPLVTTTGIDLPFSFGLHYNSNFYYITTCYDNVDGEPLAGPCPAPNAAQFGWTADATQGYGSYIVSPNKCTSGGTTYNEMVFLGYIDPQGNTHRIPPPPDQTVWTPWMVVESASGVAPEGNCVYPNGAYVEPTGSIIATDGSGLTFNLAFPVGGETYTNAWQSGAGTAQPTVVTKGGVVYSPGLAYTFTVDPDWNCPTCARLVAPSQWYPNNYISGTQAKTPNSNTISTPSQETWTAFGIAPAGPATWTNELGVGAATITAPTVSGPCGSSTNSTTCGAAGSGNSYYGPLGLDGPCPNISYSTGMPATETETYTYPTSSGPASVTLTCTQYAMFNNAGIDPALGGPFPGAWNEQYFMYAYLLTSVSLPDGSSYAFTYENTQAQAEAAYSGLGLTWPSNTSSGRIASVKYPGGRQVSYTYSYGYANDLTSGISGLTRTENQQTWTYNQQLLYTPYQNSGGSDLEQYLIGAMTTVISPLYASNESVYTFYYQEGNSSTCPGGTVFCVQGDALLTMKLDYQGTPQSAAVTNTAITSNVLTVTANNQFVSGQTVTFVGLTNAPWLNGQAVTVLSTGLSSTQFKANFTYATNYSFGDGGGQAIPTTYTNAGEIVGAALLNTEIICYNGNGVSTPTTSCPTAGIPQYPITQIDTFTQPYGATAFARASETFDSYQNVVTQSIYDFGATTQTQTLNVVGYGYTWNGSSCVAIGNGVHNTPCQIMLENSAGATLKNSRFTYDAHGNQLSTSVLTGGTTYLTTLSATYNTNGTLATRTDANNNTTSIPTYTCNGVLPTTISYPVHSINVLEGYDSVCFGKRESETEPNGYSEAAQHLDPLWRTTSQKDEEGNTATTVYTDTGFDAPAAETTETFASSVFDVYKRINVSDLSVSSQQIEAPSSANWDTVTSGYSWGSTGITSYTTLPCTTSKVHTCSGIDNGSESGFSGANSSQSGTGWNGIGTDTANLLDPGNGGTNSNGAYNTANTTSIVYDQEFFFTLGIGSPTPVGFVFTINVGNLVGSSGDAPSYEVALENNGVQLGAAKTFIPSGQDTTITIGSPTDLWGNAPGAITAAIVESNTFGVLIKQTQATAGKSYNLWDLGLGVWYIVGTGLPRVSTQHDALGRPLVTTDGGGGTTTRTYAGSSTCTSPLLGCKITTTIVGPAPPGEVVKEVANEYNGLDQLVASCDVTSATGSTSCGFGGYTGFPTIYVYNSDGTLATVSRKSSTNTQTHSFTYDSIGRTLTTTYPESGEEQFFYDTPPSTPGVACSTILPSGTATHFYGQLVKTYDANGNTTCYAYDGLNRMTAIVYSGPNFDGKNKYFVYDGATVNGLAMANAQGLIAEAYTAASITGSKVTDEGYSYTPRGELSDVYESTPNSGGYYHTTATYYANGALNTLGGTIGTTWTYSLDGKGRLFSVVNGSAVEVSSVTYNAADMPLVVTLGLGDTDTYTYDPLTNRETSYAFTIGATPETTTGALTWNANGTLRALAITDGINAGGTQTCSYGTSRSPGYDALGRLVSVACANGSTSLWSQNFAYDAFGNLTKTVPSGTYTYTPTTWNPGYNESNNQFTGSTADANGNLLTDTFHTYTWNQDDHPLTVTGGTSGSVVYDAYGRLAEKLYGTTYTEPILSPVGNLGLMSKTAVSQYRIPLPGGAVAASGINFWHKDWQNSTRLVSSASTRTSTTDQAFAPYGEPYAVFGANTNENFTGDNQDLVAGTYDTPNRELNPNQGRWISIDPLHSSWNGYSYSANPLGETDPTGNCDDPSCALDFGDGSSLTLPDDVTVNYFGMTGWSCSCFNDYYSTYDPTNNILYPQFPNTLQTTLFVQPVMPILLMTGDAEVNPGILEIDPSKLSPSDLNDLDRTLTGINMVQTLGGAWFSGFGLAGGGGIQTTEFTAPGLPEDGAVLTPYGGPGGGHHIPAQSAFRGAVGYDANAAPAISNSEMARLGVDHKLAVTPAQQTLYRAFARTGNTLTWDAVQQIETEALVRGGMNPNMAANTVQQAIQQLKNAGVSGPTRIPWGQ